jgi:hypothetical protein
MTELDLGLSIALAALIAYLLWSFNRRLNAETGRAEARHKKWECKGFETATISPRIELVRRDYASAARNRRSFACARVEKVARARCVVRQLPFFKVRGATAVSDRGCVEDQPQQCPTLVD